MTTKTVLNDTRKMKFKYCPKCACENTDAGGPKHLCRKCGYEFYFNPAPCVSIIAENSKREILLVIRARAPRKGFWDFPGGFVDPDESIEETVRREVKEELGMEVKKVSYIASSPDRYLYAGVPYRTLNLIMRTVLKSGPLKPDDDVADAKFFSAQKIPWDKLAFGYMKPALKKYIGKL